MRYSFMASYTWLFFILVTYNTAFVGIIFLKDYWCPVETLQQVSPVGTADYSVGASPYPIIFAPYLGNGVLTMQRAKVSPRVSEVF